MDTARLFDTAGDDTFTARLHHSEMQGDGYHNQVWGVGRVVGVASTGNDQANIQGTTGNDLVFSNPVYTTLTSPQHWTLARHFRSVSVDGLGGQDLVAAFGSHNNETLVVQSGYSRFESSSLERHFHGFRNQQFLAVGGGGNSAVLQGGSSPNSFDAYWNRAYFTSGQQATYLAGFQSVTALGNHGDRAILFDSADNDTFDGHGGWGRMVGQGYHNQAIGFGLTIARFSSGGDHSNLYNIQGDVTTTQQPDRVLAVYPGQFEVRSVGAPAVNLTANDFGQVPSVSGLALRQLAPLGLPTVGLELTVSLPRGLPQHNPSAWSGLVHAVEIPRAAGETLGRNATRHFAQFPETRPAPAVHSAVQSVFEHLGADHLAVVYLKPASTSDSAGFWNRSPDQAAAGATALNNLLENELVDLWFTAQGN